MEAKNTSGAIISAIEKQTAAAPVAAPKKPQTPGQALNKLLNNGAIQKQLEDSLKENAGAFSASVLSLFNGDKQLQQCQPQAVLKEALKAATLKLPIEKSLGFAYVVAYKGVPQFQIGYKGMIQLCMRTGAYKYINADKVYEGEYKSTDKLTGEIDISGERVSDKVVGYFAYIETLNGFKKAYYWTKDEVIAHAQKYSKSYKSSSSAWMTNFDAMAIKTVLRNLLSHYGVMSVEMVNAMAAEEPTFSEGESAETEEILISDADETEEDGANGSGEDMPEQE